MEYGKKESGYDKSDSTGHTKYYALPEKQEKEEQQKLPTFKDIFYNLPVSGTISSPCTYYNGVLYFPCLDTHIYAVEASSGKLIWKFKTGGPLAWCTPLIHNNKIYFGSIDEHFYCLDLSGKLLWKKHTGDIFVTMPSAIGDNIFITNGAGYVFCFSEDGKEKWKFKMGDGATGLVVGVNGLIFASSYDKHLYALDMDGNLKWKFAAGERIVGPMICSGKDVIFSNNKRSFDKMPYAKNPVVYFGSYDNYLYALGVDGKELWRFNCSSCVPGGIGFHEGIVYAGTISGRLYAIDSSGKEKWNFLTGGMVVGGAEVSGENVYVASFDQKIYCLNKNGEKIWDFLTGGPISSRPLIIGNKLYIGSADSFLYCLNIDKRSVEWTFQVGMAPSSVFAKAVGGFINAFAEYDRKIFKVWVPETTRGKIQGAVLQNYSAPQGFEFGGEQVYKSNSSLSDYFGKKTPYKK